MASKVMSKTPSDRALIHTLFSITRSVSALTATAPWPAAAFTRESSLSSRQVVISPSSRRISASALPSLSRSAGSSSTSVV